MSSTLVCPQISRPGSGEPSEEKKSESGKSGFLFQVFHQVRARVKGVFTMLEEVIKLVFFSFFSAAQVL